MGKPPADPPPWCCPVPWEVPGSHPRTSHSSPMLWVTCHLVMTCGPWTYQWLWSLHSAPVHPYHSLGKINIVSLQTTYNHNGRWLLGHLGSWKPCQISSVSDCLVVPLAIGLGVRLPSCPARHSAQCLTSRLSCSPFGSVSDSLVFPLAIWLSVRLTGCPAFYLARCLTALLYRSPFGSVSDCLVFPLAIWLNVRLPGCPAGYSAWCLTTQLSRSPFGSVSGY
jgi:hypothetical protein